MGMGATNTADRVSASLGQLTGVTPDFISALDVPHAGVLLALPALLACGLLTSTESHFQSPEGYYRVDSLFMLLALMALSRVKNIEALRQEQPGEWGKLLGLDRIPEAKTLRNKIATLSENNQPEQWAAELCQYWIEANPEEASQCYIDGHVRVYHGHQTKLPKHHVSRQKLCQRATTDYWVNAMDGQPFFVVNQVVDPGLIQVVEHEIVPLLEKRIPTPIKEDNDNEMENNPVALLKRHRFTLIFDREGYSPDFFKRMKKLDIACITYRKYVGENWPDGEFTPQEVSLWSGEKVTMKRC